MDIASKIIKVEERNSIGDSIAKIKLIEIKNKKIGRRDECISKIIEKEGHRTSS